MFRSLFVLILVGLSFSASADIALPFNATARVETPLYAQAVGNTQENVAILDGFHFKQTAQVATPCNGAMLTTVVSVSIEPNLMNYGESAFVTFKTTEIKAPSDNVCLREFAARLNPMDVEVELPLGEYNLDIKNPADKSIAYQVHVAYQPLMPKEMEVGTN